MKELDPIGILLTAEHQLAESGVENRVRVCLNPQMLRVCAHNTWRYMEEYRKNNPLLIGDEEDRFFMLHEENGYSFLEYSLLSATRDMNRYHKSSMDVFLNGYDMRNLKFVINRNHVNDNPEDVEEYYSGLDKNDFMIFLDVVNVFLAAGGQLPSEIDSNVNHGKKLKFKL